MNRLILLVCVLIVCLTSCRTPSTPTPTDRPRNAAASNNAWQPQHKTFDGFEMVRVPPGCFMMGSLDGRRDERPPHEVCFTRAFWIDRYEVTSRQYGSEGAYPGPNRPRENLTWFEARDFCARRGARLPTEAEWEYAARGVDNWLYPWGNILLEDRLNLDKRHMETSEVGSFPLGASWVGAEDLSGNVWEWTSSLYLPYPYRADDGREDPTDTVTPRVFRGGWQTYQDRGASAVWRFRMPPSQRDWRVGFRCAKDE